MNTDFKSLCLNCIHHRAPKPRPAIKPGTSAKQHEAYLKWRTSEQERLINEKTRWDNNYAFDYEPLFFHWCSFYTPDWECLQKIRKDWLSNKSLEQYEQEGKEWTMDPVTGEFKPVYVLCSRTNPSGLCSRFQSKHINRYL